MICAIIIRVIDVQDILKIIIIRLIFIRSLDMSNKSKSQKMIFSAALMLSAVSANDAVSGAQNKLKNLLEDNHAISPERRFNLGAMMLEQGAVEELQENYEFWREAEHEYEPPEHDPKYHEPMPTGPVRTVHEMPISTRAHPAEQEHRTSTEAVPTNYFYEYPEPPRTAEEEAAREEMEEEEEEELEREEREEEEAEYELELEREEREEEEAEQVAIEHTRTERETEEMAKELQEELARRHLGHKHVKTPIWVKASLSDIKDTKSHKLGVTEVIETVYDDFSSDRMHMTTEADQIVETNVSMLPDDEGILKTFIDRYTTMLIHDSIFMEEMPSPHFMHQSLSLLSPAIQGALQHDPRVILDHHDENQYIDEQTLLHGKQPSLHDLLREAEESHLVTSTPYHAQKYQQEDGIENVNPEYYKNAEELANEGHRIFDFPLASSERAYHLNLQASDRPYFVDAKEGASHLTETLGMHFVKPESQQILDREAESAHRHRHHALTRYEPDHWQDPDEDMYDYGDHEGHYDSHHLDSHHHRDASHHATEGYHQVHGLPVHDRYGERSIEHNPYQHEFVHGTNYELSMQRAAPVVEHNPHAFSAKTLQATHKGDLRKSPAPKEVFPKQPQPAAPQQMKKDDPAIKAKQDEKTATSTKKQLPSMALHSHALF